MTQQIPESMSYEGKKWRMYTLPLWPLRKKGGRLHTLEFQLRNTGCWRCYRASWAILDQKLFIQDIDARWCDGSRVDLGMLFPGQAQPVMADWYSGELHIGTGDPLRYSKPYLFGNERDMFIKVEKGIVISSRNVDNRHFTNLDFCPFDDEFL